MKHYDPQNYTSKNSLGFLLKTNHSLLHESADLIFASQDISFLQWLALIKLKEGTAVTASDLCRKMFHDNGAVTRLLDQLEERGYITRQRNQQDRRVVNLQITDAGLLKLKELTPPFIEKLNSTLEPFSAEEFAELTRLLEKLKSCFEQGISTQTANSTKEPL